MKEKSFLSMKDLAVDDRPREKLMFKGKDVLSDAELIAVLIGSGSRNKSAVDLAREILNDVNNRLRELSGLTIESLKKYKGIGDAKAISIVAALELGRRYENELPEQRPKIAGSQSAYAVLRPVLGNLQHEEFRILYLDSSNKVIRNMLLSKGGINRTSVDIRIAFKNALQLNAVSMILAHNHPSGNLAPSTSDKKLTEKFIAAGASLDIKVVDHLIVSEDGFFSFSDEGIID